MDKIIKSSELKERIKIKALFWGEAGAGKTHISLNTPNPLCVDTERGAEAFFAKFFFDLLSTPSIEQFENLIKELQKSCPYETLILDTITGLEKLYIQKYSKGEKITLAEWGVIKPKLDEVMMSLIGLPVNLILTAHSQNIWDTNKFQIIGQRPHIFKGIWSYYVDIIGKLERKNGGMPTLIINKSRFALPPKIENASFDKLRSLICEGWEGKKQEEPDDILIGEEDNRQATPAQVKKLHALLGELYEGDKEQIEAWKQGKKVEIAKLTGLPISHTSEIPIQFMSAMLNELLAQLEKKKEVTSEQK